MTQELFDTINQNGYLQGYLQSIFRIYGQDQPSTRKLMYKELYEKISQHDDKEQLEEFCKQCEQIFRNK